MCSRFYPTRVFDFREERSEHGGVESARRLLDQRCLEGSESFLLRRRRSADIDGAAEQWFLATQSSAFLQLAQLPPQPQLAARSVIDEDHIARSQVFFVLQPGLCLVFVEEREDDLEARTEE